MVEVVGDTDVIDKAKNALATYIAVLCGYYYYYMVIIDVFEFSAVVTTATNVRARSIGSVVYTDVKNTCYKYY